MRLWVVDTSPLIFLAKLNRLDLLSRGADEILIPPAVLLELRMRPDQATQRVEEALTERFWRWNFLGPPQPQKFRSTGGVAAFSENLGPRRPKKFQDADNADGPPGNVELLRPHISRGRVCAAGSQLYTDGRRENASRT